LTKTTPEPDSFAPREKPSGIARWIPGVATLRGYSFGWLARDLFAGLALTAILVPAGLAYAEAAGLPAVYGLYATAVPLLVYALLGPSRILVVGPDSALAALIVATVAPLATGPEHLIVLAGMLSILAGGMCILSSLARLGFVTELLSKPIRYGYMNGIAVTMLVSQLPTALGFSVKGQDVPRKVVGLYEGILGGQTNGSTLAVSAVCLLVILASKRWTPKVPGVLLAVVGATVSVGLLKLADRGVSVVGPLPEGLPAFRVPLVSVAELRALVSGAAAIAVISFADMSVLSRAFAKRTGQEVDPNQELFALGAANVAAGLFQGFPVTASSSRTPVAESAGAKTQVAGIVGACSVAILLVFAPTLLKDLPHAALAAVVISACLGLIEITGVVRLFRLRKSEFCFCVACFLGVILAGAIEGIFIAVGLALLAFFWRAWRPYDAVLGRVDGLKGYHDITRYPEAKRIPGLVLFRWDAPLFFANAEMFREHVAQAVSEAPTPTRWVVVAAEPVTDIDITAADMLADLDRRLHDAGMDLCFAEMKDPVKDLLKRYGMFSTFGPENFFPTLGQAVDQYIARHEVEWRDWDDSQG
jgi:high affinity sulfate transporter 1